MHGVSIVVTAVRTYILHPVFSVIKAKLLDKSRVMRCNVVRLRTVSMFIRVFVCVCLSGLV